MAKDLTLCRDCQYRPVEFKTDPKGKVVKHGFCPCCFEFRVKRMAGGGGRRSERSRESRENVQETKFGTGQR